MPSFAKLCITLTFFMVSATYAASDESVLMPGSRLVAGDLSQNEFYILGANQTDPAAIKPQAAPVPVPVQIIDEHKEQLAAKKMAQQLQTALKRVRVSTLKKKTGVTGYMVMHKDKRKMANITKIPKQKFADKKGIKKIFSAKKKNHSQVVMKTKIKRKINWVRDPYFNAQKKTVKQSKFAFNKTHGDHKPLMKLARL